MSLNTVAAQVNISPSYFSTIFSGETGQTFVEYLTELRIEKAKQLLATASYSIKEICLGVGYSDPNYFSRIFKKVTGQTPTEYRENRF